MEFRLSGNALEKFARSITCLTLVGNELAIQASSSQIAFHTLNASHPAYQSVTMKPDLFDVYNVPGSEVKCSVLLKDICVVFRTPILNTDTLTVHLPDVDASKIQWTLQCIYGLKKSYWITCNVEPDIHYLADITCKCNRTDNANNNDQAFSQSQHHPSNWVEADDDDDDSGDDNELCVQSTPPYCEAQHVHTIDDIKDRVQMYKKCYKDYGEDAFRGELQRLVKDGASTFHGGASTSRGGASTAPVGCDGVNRSQHETLMLQLNEMLRCSEEITAYEFLWAVNHFGNAPGGLTIYFGISPELRVAYIKKFTNK